MELKILILAVFCGVLGLAFGQVFERPADCQPCDPNQCDEDSVKRCPAGTVKDRCSCCDVCAKTEYEMCDHPEAKNPKGLSYGICGNNLECRIRSDLTDSEAPEALCYCLDETPICGTDGVTYANKCQLTAAANIKGEDIKKNKKGPCANAPVIVSKPENIKNSTGANIFLVCEAKGFPIPQITWTWTRVDGKTVILPNDDIHVSVNVRGGPEKWEVTGWLQVMELEKHHEGDYMCVAENLHGSDKATARVNVHEDKEHQKKHHKHGKHHKTNHNEI